MLHVCQEARAEGLTKYMLSTDNEGKQDKVHTVMNRFYFYRAIDRLYIPYMRNAQCNRLVLEDECGMWRTAQTLVLRRNDLRTHQFQFPNLKEAIVYSNAFNTVERNDRVHDARNGLVAWSAMRLNAEDTEILAKIVERDEKEYTDLWIKQALLKGKHVGDCPKFRSMALCGPELDRIDLTVPIEDVETFLDKPGQSYRRPME